MREPYRPRRQEAFSLNFMIPIRLERRVAEDTHGRNQEIEYQYHDATRPHEAQVDLREIEGKKVGADGELEHGDPNEVNDLYDSHVVAVVKHIVGFEDLVSSMCRP
jgi:hypothetical protein